MFRRLVTILVMAMVIAVAGVAYDAGSAAADEPVPPPTTPEDGNEPVDQQQVETQETASTPKSGDGGGAGTRGICLYQTLEVRTKTPVMKRVHASEVRAVSA